MIGINPDILSFIRSSHSNLLFRQLVISELFFDDFCFQNQLLINKHYSLSLQIFQIDFELLLLLMNQRLIIFHYLNNIYINGLQCYDLLNFLRMNPQKEVRKAVSYFSSCLLRPLALLRTPDCKLLLFSTSVKH